jgi:hypothetical protein
MTVPLKFQIHEESLTILQPDLLLHCLHPHLQITVLTCQTTSISLHHTDKSIIHSQRT